MSIFDSVSTNDLLLAFQEAKEAYVSARAARSVFRREIRSLEKALSQTSEYQALEAARANKPAKYADLESRAKTLAMLLSERGEHVTLDDAASRAQWEA